MSYWTRMGKRTSWQNYRALNVRIGSFTRTSKCLTWPAPEGWGPVTPGTDCWPRHQPAPAGPEWVDTLDPLTRADIAPTVDQAAATLWSIKTGGWETNTNKLMAGYQFNKQKPEGTMCTVPAPPTTPSGFEPELIAHSESRASSLTNSDKGSDLLVRG